MPNLYSSDFLYRTAKEYFRIGTIAAGHFIKNFFNDEYSHAKIQAPAVNISFALELTLKDILLHERGNTPKGHDFIKLYQLISDEAKEKIADYFKENLAGRDFGLISFIKKEGGDETNNHDYNTIEEVLKMHQDAFIDWRYAHEFPMKKTTTLDFNF